MEKLNASLQRVTKVKQRIQRGNNFLFASAITQIQLAHLNFLLYSARGAKPKLFHVTVLANEAVHPQDPNKKKVFFQLS